jgi:hypothetical protein
MMPHRILRAATWVLSRLVLRSDREALVGDLTEEYALRVRAVSASAAGKWYLRQLCASAAPLLWMRIARSAWIATLGVALFAYIAVGVVEFVVNWALAGSSATGTAAYNPLGMAITFPMVVLIGYCAGGIRRTAPAVLGALMLLSVSAMTLWGNERLPTWYTIAYFCVGPAAAFIGSSLRSRRAVR